MEIQGRDYVETFTYGALLRLSELIGRRLTDGGFEAGARAAILAGNHAHWLAGYLGIIASGGVVVPLDTSLHADQLAILLADSGASWLFADEKHIKLAREAAAGMPVAVEPLIPAGVPAAGEFTAVAAGEDTLAALLYTSGTTGDPKGVMLTHGNIAAEIEAGVAWSNLGPDDALLGVLPLFHVLAQVTNFLLPMAVGARVVFLETLNSAEVLRALKERDITALAAVPQLYYVIHDRIFKEIATRSPALRAVLRALMALTRFARGVGFNPGRIFFPRIHALFGPRMRILLSAGARFDPRIARNFHSLGVDIQQAYGLTETAGAAFASTRGKLVEGSAGRALSGIQAKLADAQPDEDAGCAVGEIAIRGSTVMKGYWNRSDATAAVLHDGWLSTGDLGYFDREGNLFITGRKKEIVILGNGKNIYPEEVEAHYLKSPFIKDICVLAREARAGDPASERLFAVVVPDFDELKRKRIVHAKEVLRFDIESLSAQLPSTKRIGGYEIWQEELPRTTTRKIKRHEVERRVRAQPEGVTLDGEPESLRGEDGGWLENSQVRRGMAVIAAMCQMPATAIRAGADLELDLGLDSMRRVELVAALEQALGGRADEARLAEVYTVRQLVDAVLESATGVAAAGVTPQAVPWSGILREEPTDPAALALGPPGRKAEAVWFFFYRALGLFARVAYRLRVTGLEKLPSRGPFLMCPNHQSYLDGLIMSSVLPWPVFRELFYVGASDIFRHGPMSLIARWRRIVAVDPDANLIPAMRAGAFGLKHGRVLVLYPEGERSIDGVPKRFKKGAAILAIHMQTPIVPVAIEGFWDAWPRGRLLPRLARLGIAFGDPIPPPPEAEASNGAYETLTAELRARVVAMWEDLRGRLAGKAPATTAAGSREKGW